MPAITFPVSSSPGAKPQESAGRLVNCFAEKAGDGARFPVIWKRCAGLRQVVDIADHSHLRGAILVNTTLVPVMDSRVYSVTRSGATWTATNLGELAGTDPVTIAKNNAATPNIVAVTTAGAFNLFTGSAPSNFADADLPQPNSVAEIDGYLIFTIGDGRIFATGLNSVSVATNSFTTEQGLALRRGVTFRGEFFAFGDKWCGVYHDAATSPFPLERKFVIPRGIAGTHAVAGWEPGWANELIWVGEDSLVYKLDGYNPVAISTAAVVRDIAAAGKAGDHGDLEAFVYMQGENAMWTLTYPGNWTWEYNLTTGNWHQRESFGNDDWRASRAVRAFDEWVIGDRDSGLLFVSDDEYYREATSPLVMTIESAANAAFPARFTVVRADLDFTAASGSAVGEAPIQTDPQVAVSWSFNGGYTFGDPVLRRLGSEGEADALVTVQRVGSAKSKGVVFRLRVSDPVHVGFHGGQMATVARAA